MLPPKFTNKCFVNIVYILTRITPNNKVLFKSYRLGQEYASKRYKPDSYSDKYQSKINQKIQEYEWQTNLLKQNSEQYVHVNTQSILLQKPLFGEEYGGKPVIKEVQVEALATKLPTKIEYLDTTNPDQPLLVKKSYTDFISSRLKTLDLISKSQQSVPRHSCWGRAQTPKVFRYTAGNKILEAGAIIDRYCGIQNSSMLTLTLPGQTVAAMSALARWSGWIVNRMLQVIRRLKSHQKKIYWFFVWEHQKRGALHMHFCLGWDVPPGVRRCLGMALRRMFYRCLLELQDKDNVDCFQRFGFQKSWRNSPHKWQWDYQEINKSVAGYFAKYCKKNTNLNGTPVDGVYQNSFLRNGTLTVSNSDNLTFYPSRYWGSSANIKRISKKLTKEIKIEVTSQEEVDMILNRICMCALNNSEPVAIAQTEFQIKSPHDDRIICSGNSYNFRFSPDDYPAIWINIVTNIMWRKVCMDADMVTFFGEEMSKHLIDTHPCVIAT